jgi:hypothetical protein
MTSLHGVGRRLRLAGYLLAAFVAVSSIADLIATNWPIAVHDPRWRIGATTLIISAAPINLLAIFLCIAIAFLAAHRRVLSFLGALCALASLAYLGLCVELALDLLQLRQRVRADLVTNYDVTIVLGELRLVFASAVSLALSFAAFRVRRHAGRVVVEAAPAHASRFFMGNVAAPGARVGVVEEP